jgi:signal peptidase I
MRFVLPIVLSTFILLIGVSTGFYFINPYDVASEKISERFLGGKPYRIPSKSMLNTLVVGDYIIVSRKAYINDAPQRNDVIVFDRFNAKKNKNTAYIKRVLAIAGDTIKIKNGKVLINNILINEPYVNTKNRTKKYSLTMKTKHIPTGEIFVLGDNRDNSNDSRMYGSIAITKVTGKAVRLLYGKNGRSGDTIK